MTVQYFRATMEAEEYYMRKLLSLLMALLVWMMAVPAMASLDDTRATIAQEYGEYRRVIDTDNQPWTREQWEKTGYKKAQADTFIHQFRREDINTYLFVQYESDKPDSYVRMQRFEPDMPFQIKDFKKVFPEIYAILSTPQAVVFASHKEISKNLPDKISPVTMGVALKKELPGNRKAYFTLLAFDIADEGRLVKDPKFIDENTYIRTFTIERTYLTYLKDNIGGDWKPIKNYFVPATK